MVNVLPELPEAAYRVSVHVDALLTKITSSFIVAVYVVVCVVVRSTADADDGLNKGMTTTALKSLAD
jgi:hypothetical protein